MGWIVHRTGLKCIFLINNKCKACLINVKLFSKTKKYIKFIKYYIIANLKLIYYININVK